MTTWLQVATGLEQTPATISTCVGKVGHITIDGFVWVDFPGNENGLVLARLANSDHQPIFLGMEVLLVFDSQSPAKPIIVAAVRDRLTVDGESVGREKREAVVDGRRVVLEGDEEVVLRCGKSSITLRRNGKISVQGVELVSRATGTNRIRGGSVAIN